jgi:cysteine desulfurase
VRAYLDHAATTPVLAEAAAAAIPWLTERFGNPSGSHSVARAARSAVDAAREEVAAVLGVDPGDVVFTGGGTEADNLGVRGPIEARRLAGRPPGTVVTTAVEHHAVLGAAARSGVPVRTVAVTAAGVVDLDALEDALDADVAVVSVMLVNNEVGTIQPLDDVAEAVRRKAPGALLHTDAVQGLRWLDLREATAAADLVTISAHKFGGLQGVGALAVRPGAGLHRLLEGGGQERERRPGTHNVAGIVAMAAAAAATDAGRKAYLDEVAARRDRLVAAVAGGTDGVSVLAPAGGLSGADGAGGTAAGFANLCFEGVESETLLVLLDEAGVAASAGSACASGAIEASHVLLAMGVAERLALGSLRLTLAPSTTDAEIDLAAAAVAAAVARLRGR